MQEETGSRRNQPAGWVRAAATAAVVVTGVALLFALRATAAHAPHTHVVEIKGFAFVPDTVRAAVGDTVVFINRDVVPHTATAESWDSGELKTSMSWQMVVNSDGTTPYLCALHPAMKGTLIAR